MLSNGNFEPYDEYRILKMYGYLTNNKSYLVRLRGAALRGALVRRAPARTSYSRNNNIAAQYEAQKITEFALANS